MGVGWSCTQIKYFSGQKLHGGEVKSHSLMTDSWQPMDYMDPWTTQSMEFSRPEYWSGQPFPSPGDLLNQGIEPGSPALPVDSLPTSYPGSRKVKVKVAQLCLTLCHPMDYTVHGIFLDFIFNSTRTDLPCLQQFSPTQLVIPSLPLLILFSESILQSYQICLKFHLFVTLIFDFLLP